MVFRQSFEVTNDDNNTGFATQVNSKTTTLNPLHVNWVINTDKLMSQLAKCPEQTKSGFRKVRLLSDY